MNITKKHIQNRTKLSPTLDIIYKINYIQVENSEKFNSFCLEIAESLAAYFKGSISRLTEERTGTLIAVNEMSVSYFDQKVISLKFDLTVSHNSVLIFHRRYAVNYLLSHDILLIPQLIKGLGKCRADLFFLTSREEELFAVPIVKKSIETPVKLGRKSQIDSFCNGQPRRVKIKKLPRNNGDRTPSP